MVTIHGWASTDIRPIVGNLVCPKQNVELQGLHLIAALSSENKVKNVCGI